MKSHYKRWIESPFLWWPLQYEEQRSNYFRFCTGLHAKPVSPEALIKESTTLVVLFCLRWLLWKSKYSKHCVPSLSPYCHHWLVKGLGCWQVIEQDMGWMKMFIVFLLGAWEVLSCSLVWIDLWYLTLSLHSKFMTPLTVKYDSLLSFSLSHFIP